MKTVRVRVAVAVDKTGNWSASGWKDDKENDAMGVVTEELEEGENRYWLEAELEIPEELCGKVVQAEVTKDE